MIKIKVRYLGSLIDISNTSTEEIILEEGSTVKHLLIKIVEKHPLFKTLIKIDELSETETVQGLPIAIVLNSKILTSRKDLMIPLKENDVIVLSPVIAGG